MAGEPVEFRSPPLQSPETPVIAEHILDGLQITEEVELPQRLFARWAKGRLRKYLQVMHGNIRLLQSTDYKWPEDGCIYMHHHSITLKIDQEDAVNQLHNFMGGFEQGVSFAVRGITKVALLDALTTAIARQADGFVSFSLKQKFTVDSDD